MAKADGGADDPPERISASSAPSQANVERVHAMIVYHREVLRTPLRTLEAEIGISRSAVDKFHRQRSHPGKNWPKLRDWYIQMRQNRAREEYQTPASLLVSSMLLGVEQLPNSSRADALRHLADMWHTLYAKANMPPAEWVQQLADMAEREGSS